MALADDQTANRPHHRSPDSFASVTPRDIPVIAPVVTLMGDLIAVAFRTTPPQALLRSGLMRA